MHSTHLLEHKGTYKVVQNHLLKTLLFFFARNFHEFYEPSTEGLFFVL